MPFSICQKKDLSGFQGRPHWGVFWRGRDGRGILSGGEMSWVSGDWSSGLGACSDGLRGEGNKWRTSPFSKV